MRRHETALKLPTLVVAARLDQRVDQLVAVARLQPGDGGPGVRGRSGRSQPGRTPARPAVEAIADLRQMP
ncbi:hypothetical protein CLM82_31185 [Streptomyces albidoflavus]|nr:hypothetical protein CLM82_31185 [Streptomyces albidoflavus]